MYDGVISGVTEWGLYVEINENKCRGHDCHATWATISMSSTKELLSHRTSSSPEIQSWRPIKIKVARANLAKKQLDFVLAET